MRRLNLAGKRFGSLVALRFVRINKSKRTIWLFKCDCGNMKEIGISHVVTGTTISCGCMQKLRVRNKLFIHGLSRTKFYKTWDSIRRRCTKKYAQNYYLYGGRGIKTAWDTFYKFKNDMFDSYNNHIDKYGEKNTSIDRIDNNSNYCKENCRWTTNIEQARNRRDNKFITYEGKTKTQAEWSGIFELHPTTLSRRVRSGWPLEKLFTRPRKIKSHTSTRRVRLP